MPGNHPDRKLCHNWQYFFDVCLSTAAELSAAIDAVSLDPTSSAAFSYFDVRKAFTGVNGCAYGNSWMRWANGVTNGTFLQLLPASLGLSAVALWANGGYRIQDTVVSAYSPGLALSAPDVSWPWATGTKGMVIVGNQLNNLMEPDDARNRATALEGTRALVALLSASERVEQDAAQFAYRTSPTG